MKYKLINVVLIAVPLWVAAVEVYADTQAKVYPINAVSEVFISGDTEVELVQDDSEYLRIDADAEVLARVKVDQTGKRLTIEVKHSGGIFSWFSGESMHVRVNLRLKDINYLDLSGAARIKSGDLVGDKLKVEASGASEATFGSIHYDNLLMDLSGASNVHVRQIVGEKMASEISGASNLDINEASSIAQLKTDASGASNLRARKLKALDAYLEASGASTIEVAVSNQLKARASGASVINYYGAPQADTKTSGASQINAHGAQD
jgi:hypothetical protein